MYKRQPDASIRRFYYTRDHEQSQPAQLVVLEYNNNTSAWSDQTIDLDEDVDLLAARGDLLIAARHTYFQYLARLDFDTYHNDDPGQPLHHQGTLYLSGYVRRMQVQGDLLYVLHHRFSLDWAELSVFDISEPAQPRFITRLPLGFQDFDISGVRLYGVCLLYTSPSPRDRS